METQSPIPYQEPRDLNISSTYFVENKGPGLNAVAGLAMAMGCGFENNGKYGINLMNEGRLFACRASTHGVQPYLVNAFLNGGSMMMDSCRIEGYGGFEGKMKLAKVAGSGSVDDARLRRQVCPRYHRQHQGRRGVGRGTAVPSERLVMLSWPVSGQG